MAALTIANGLRVLNHMLINNIKVIAPKHGNAITISDQEMSAAVKEIAKAGHGFRTGSALYGKPTKS